MHDNRNPEVAWTYHNATKHSYTSIRSNPHFMDWPNQPLPFKIYPTLELLRLPGEVRQTGVAALSAIAESVSADTNASPDLEAIAQLLYLSAGITRKRSYSGGEIYFRAAACTGALYEVELYLVCGVVAARVNRLLDVDPQREVAFSLVALGHVAALPPPAPAEISPLGLETVPLSQREEDYPLMREMHAASSLDSAAEVEAWRGHTPTTNISPPAGPIVSLEPFSDGEMPRDPIEQVIQRRGSTRRFARSPITVPQLSTMLDRATRGVPADFLDPPGAQLNDLYL